MSDFDLTQQARFFSLSLDMLCISDFDGYFKQLNPAWGKTTGFSRDELMSKPFIEFVHPDDYESTLAETANLTRNNEVTINFENRYICKDGSIKWIQWSATPFPKEQLIYAVARDVTQEKQAERILQFRTEFEKLTTSLSTQFINLVPDEIDLGINQALGTIGKLMEVDRSYIFILSPDGAQMNNSYEWCAEGIESQKENLQKLSMTDYPWFNTHIKDQEFVYIPQVTTMLAEAQAEQAWFQSYRTQSLINIPMIHRDSLVGFLGFDSIHTEKSWGEEDIRLFKIVAEMFVNILQRKQVEQREDLAYEFGRQMTTLRDPETLLIEIVNRLQETFGYYHAHVYLYNQTFPDVSQPKDEIKDMLTMREGTGEAGWAMKERGHAIPLHAEKSLVAQSARSQIPVIVNNISLDPNHLPNPLLPDTRSEAAIPLHIGLRLLGVLDVQHTRVNHFTEEEVRTLQIVAGQLSIALSNAQLFDENAHRLEIIENASTLIALMSLEDQTIIYINPAGAALAGYSNAPAIVNKPLKKLYRAKDFKCLKNEALPAAFDKGIWRGESTLRRIDGNLVPIDQTIFVINDDDGQPQTLATIIMDITERKQAEQALQKANEELEGRVEERTEALMEQTKELVRSNAELERFAYVASHDLQEPLRMITSYVQLLARRYKGKLDDDADDFINYAVDGAARMQQLINDLLAYSRVGTRGKPLEPTDSQAALAQALHNLQPTILENMATITHDPLPEVMADDLQIEQLFQNIISNAIKFRSEAPPKIHVSVRENNSQEWVFSVQDNGIGIDSKYEDRIFIIFQRLHTPDKYSGTGIGLAICKKIIERHNGKIWFESKPDAGTTFYFTIPMIRGDNND